MAAQMFYSNKELKGVDGSGKQDLLMAKGVNWNEYPIKFKRRVVGYKETYQKKVEGGFVTSDTIPATVTRNRWTVDNPPIFTKDNEYLYNIINR